MVAKYWFEQIAGLAVEVDVASEFRYREPALSPKSCAIFVSQSGETADTLAALRYATDKVAKVVARGQRRRPRPSRAKATLPCRSWRGSRLASPRPRRLPASLTVLALLALKAAHDRGRMDHATMRAHVATLRNLPGLMNHALSASAEIAAIAEELAEAQDVLFLGRGAMFPLALEGALKLKEISYIHAEGYAVGELKHGPIALIDARRSGDRHGPARPSV